MTQANDLPSRMEQIEIAVLSLIEASRDQQQQINTTNLAVDRLADAVLQYMQRTEDRMEQIDSRMERMEESLLSTNAAIERLDAIILRMDQRMTLLENR